jgi:AcrR family transcriptional regulator
MPKVTEEYRDARRRHVLDAACRCFLRDGFHATSMADVCREAEVSSGVVYLYFSSKNEIIAAIAAQNLSRVSQAAADLAQRHGSRGAGAVLAELLGHIRTEHERDGLASVALLTWSESLRNKVLAESLRDAFTEVRRSLTTLLREQEPSGGLGPLGPEATASIMISVLLGYVTQLATQPPDATAPVPDAVTALWGPDVTDMTDSGVHDAARLGPNADVVVRRAPVRTGHVRDHDSGDHGRPEPAPS